MSKSRVDKDVDDANYTYEETQGHLAPRAHAAQNDRSQRLQAHVEVKALVFGDGEREGHALMCFGHCGVCVCCRGFLSQAGFVVVLLLRDALIYKQRHLLRNQVLCLSGFESFVLLVASIVCVRGFWLGFSAAPIYINIQKYNRFFQKFGRLKIWVNYISTSLRSACFTL